MRLAGRIVIAALLASAPVAGAATPTTDDLARWTSINAAFPPPTADEAAAAVAAAEADCPLAGATLGPIAPATAWRRIDEAIRAGQLVNGWSVIVRRPACPPDRAEARYVLLRDSAGALSAQWLHDGRSYIDLDSLVDTALPRALRTVAMAASRDIPGCAPNPVTLVRTEVVDEAGLGEARFGLRGGAWREQWLFAACGRTLSLFVDIEGRADGAKVTVAPWASLRR